MYESHFGLSGTPFSLNPDPGFYFQSKGHGHALSYLRFGVHQGEGFVVVTGDIGAGKTTLVRTLLAELDASSIVAAQIVSTQLDAGDLLRSVAIAFGLAPKNLSKAELIASIEAFLTLLVTQKRRALLVVDEAQNLNLQAIEELRMLSNFQLGNHALLQSFLVGQPELRELLTSKPMEQFRQRVIASCHLGPMDERETQAYIEHRLHKVGWANRPELDTAAFERIHHWTTGIPRRVNLLCNRLLLAAFLSGHDLIDAATVDRVADEANAETRVAEPGPRGATEVAAVPWPVVRVRPEPMAALPDAAPAAPRFASGPIMCVAVTRRDDIKMAMLLKALQQRKALPLILVRIGDPAEFELNDAFIERLGLEIPTVDIATDARSPCSEIAQVIRDFESVVGLHRPSAVVLAGLCDAALACAIVADKTGTPLAHVDAGRLDPTDGRAALTNQSIIEALARLHCVVGSDGAELPVQQGGLPRVVVSGHLLGDAASEAIGAALSPGAVLSGVDPVRRAQLVKDGYCVVMLGRRSLDCDQALLSEVLAVLRRLSAQVPLVWPLDRDVADRLDAMGMRKMLRGERIVLIPAQGYVETIALLAGAKCVLTDSRDVQVEAGVLEVPSLVLEDEERPLRLADQSTRLLEDMRRRPATARIGLDIATVPAEASLRANYTVSAQIADHLIDWVGTSA